MILRIQLHYTCIFEHHIQWALRSWVYLFVVLVLPGSGNQTSIFFAGLDLA